MKNQTDKKKVIALGFFDGIHLGHQALLRQAVERAAQRNLSPAVFTFDRSPREFVSGAPVPLLTTAESRREVVRSLFPIEEVIVLPFNREMMTMPCEDFLRMLIQTYQAGWLVAGHNYRFGYRHQGTSAMLEELAPRMGFGCDIIPAVTLDGITVSSTHIRLLLERGDVKNAGRFLGYPFTLFGQLEGGLSSPSGTPLPRMTPPPQQLTPAPGIYLTCAVTEAGAFPCIAAVASFSDGTRLELRPLDRNARLIGCRCRLQFLNFLCDPPPCDDPAGLPELLERTAGEAAAHFPQ